MSERVLWIDIFRTIALIGMIIFHFVYDLELFGLVAAGTITQGGWPIFARLVAGAFLFISGLSFVLTHQAGFRRKSWARRFFRVGGAAALVTIATLIVFPDRFIYFGILHAIAAASVVGIAALALPGWGLLMAVLFIVAVDVFLPSGVFVSPMLAWTGLSSTIPPSLDFIPLIPWLSAFLAGMAFAKMVPIAKFAGLKKRHALATALAWPGQHSLLVYLLHQPVLLSVLWLLLSLR